MTQEEKAKRYDEALEEAKKWHKSFVMGQNYPATDIKVSYECIFPDLKESEDERIRKALISILKSDFEKDTTIYDISVGDIIAWLEKQGGQKSTDKAKPKFNVGEWITDGYLHNKITDVLEDHYIVETKYAKRSAILFDYESRYHLWTIQDAKDGDVLCCENGWTCIFKTLVNDETFSSYCFMDETKWFCETGSECHTLKKEFIKAYNGKIYPATKEQRDLLFSKMKEAGYEWDADKKEPRKIEQLADKTEPNFKFKVGQWIVATGKCIYCITKIDGFNVTLVDVDNNEYVFDVNSLNNARLLNIADSADECIYEYEKGRADTIAEMQKHWSEDDDEMLDSIIEEVRYIGDFPDYPTKEENELYDECLAKVEWLKSLRPQNRWKPNEEQIKAFELMIRSWGESGTLSPYDGTMNYLLSLLNDLKKL